MKIINTYHKRLSWDNPEFVFSIDTNEIKDVPDKIAISILRNKHIKKVAMNRKKETKKEVKKEVKKERDKREKRGKRKKVKTKK